jgi:DNA-binding NarL/FixJ family response regulator
MRALLIDDQQLIRESLEMLLQVMMPDISLDHAASAHGAIQLAATIDYQLILLDWWLGEVNGGQCIEQLRAAGSTAPVVVVSGDDNEQVVQQALALGAAGYVTKSGSKNSLLDAIRVALGGGRYLPPRRAAGPAAPIPGVPVRRELQEVFPDLTERQIEVFRVLIRGQSDKQIARELNIAESTVKTHVRAIFQALGAQRRSEAAYIARQRGASEC